MVNANGDGKVPVSENLEGRFLFFPALVADQGHKGHWHDAFLLELVALAPPALQVLPAAAADRDDQPAAFG